MTPAPVILTLLAGQAGLLALAPWLADDATAPPAAVFAFVTLAIASGLLWLAGREALSALPLAATLAIFAALRLPWLLAPPVLDTDHLRFIWDGQLVLAGLSPWGPPPVAGVPAALGAEGAALAAILPFAGLRSIYPVGAQAVFALGQLLAPWDILGLRLLLLAADLATLLLLRAVLRRAGLPEGRAALWAACPLLPVLVVGGAHPDALLPPLILGALLAAASGRGGWAGALLGLAVGVKVWPLLLAPLLARALVGGFGGAGRAAERQAGGAAPPAAGREPAGTSAAQGADQRPGGGASADPRPGGAAFTRWLAALAPFGAALALVGGACLAPVALSALAPDAGVAAYAAGWSANNAAFTWAVAGLGAVLATPDALLRPAVALAAGAVALGAAARARPGIEGLLAGALVVSAVTFYLSPAQFPWYMLWFLPFAAALARGPLLLPAALLPVYYLWFPFRDAGLGAVFAYGIAALHALPVVLWLLAERRR